MAKEKRKKKKVSEKVLKDDTGLVCVNCRTSIPGNINLCPKCGLSPSVQALSDIYQPGVIRKLSRKKKGEE